MIARCFAFVGPDLPLNAHFAIGNFIQDALKADCITVVGDGSPLRTYLEQADLSHWLWTLMMEGFDGEAYNVGSDQVISIAELAFLVRDLLAPGKEVNILGSAQQAGARSRYVPSVKKIAALHSLFPRISLARAITRTARSDFSSTFA